MEDKVTRSKMRLASIRNLVFQGGSVRGIAYLGADQTLIEEGLSPTRLERIAGTSAGSLNAMLLSCGYTANEMSSEMQNLDFKSLLDQDTANLQSMVIGLKDKKGFNFFSSLTSDASNVSQASSILKSTFGLFHGETLRLLVERLIKQKTSINHITFLELHKLREKNQNLYKDLYVIGINVNTSQSEIFSWEHTPNVIISDAVRISMSMPFIYKPHQIYCKINNSRQLENTKKDALYIDGGLTDNYPLFVFDNYQYLSKRKKAMAPIKGHFSNPETLGLCLVDKQRRDFLVENTNELPHNNLLTFLPFFRAVLNTIYRKQESDQVLMKEQWRSIYIDTCGIDILDFDLDETSKNRLIESGIRGTKEFLISDINRQSRNLIELEKNIIMPHVEEKTYRISKL